MTALIMMREHLSAHCEQGDAMLFQTFDHTAFRLEVRDRYNAPRQAESFKEFLAGEPDDLACFEIPVTATALLLPNSTAVLSEAVRAALLSSSAHVGLSRGPIWPLGQAHDFLRCLEGMSTSHLG
ncbi:MAG: DUF6879 family protein [Pseudonocardiaceae bacterium]